MKNKSLLLLLLLIPSIAQAKSGCCSSHGGVAGCSADGRQICADGELSPTCTCTPSYVYGCTDISAKNYNSNANMNDGSCSYYVKGCTDINSINYNNQAEKDDGSCIKKVPGCTDKEATNYNELANTDDKSCQYKKVIESKVADVATSTTTSSSNDAGNGLLSIAIIGVVTYFVGKKIKTKKRES